MCGKQELHGADSIDGWVNGQPIHSDGTVGDVPRPFDVLLEDDDGGRIMVRVPAAYGKHDAYNQAKYDNPYYHALNATEAA